MWHDLIVRIELVPLLLLASLQWMAGARASELPWSGSPGRLQRKCLAMLARTVYLSLLGAVTSAAVLALTLFAGPEDGLARLLVQLPLVAGPLVLLWAAAYPRLERLRRTTPAQRGDAQAAGRRLHPVTPGLVAPYYVASLGSLAALYIALIPDGSFGPDTAAVPLALFAAASVAAWRHQASRTTAVRPGARTPLARPQQGGPGAEAQPQPASGLAQRLKGLEVRR